MAGRGSGGAEQGGPLPPQRLFLQRAQRANRQPRCHGEAGGLLLPLPRFSRLQLSKVEEGGGKSRAAGRDRPKLQNAQPGRAQGRSAANGATTDVAPKRGKKGSGPKWGTGDRQDGGAEAAA